MEKSINNAWAIIYCPKESATHTLKRWNKIKAYLEEKGIAFDYVQSEGVGSIERLANMMTRAGYEQIIIVGGDAALNHAVCDIMNTESPKASTPQLGLSPTNLATTLLSFGDFRLTNIRRRSMPYHCTTHDALTLAQCVAQLKQAMKNNITF